MADHGVKHDYHIINPSPWPLLGSIAAMIMMIGAVAGFHGLFGLPKKDWTTFFIGLGLVLFTMFGWWRDVIKESHAGDHTPVVQLHLRYGMILFIASEVMFFVAWFWIFFEMALFNGHRAGEFSAIEEVRQAWSHWPPQGVHTLDPWHLPFLNTLILLLSGTTVTWAHHALQINDRKGAFYGLLLTVILGAAFTGVQAYEYHHIFSHNYFFSEEAANGGLYGSAFILATGFHGLHVLIGTIFLLVCLFRLMAGHFTPQKHFGFEAAAWYWHFVDVVWLFLFAFVYVIFAGSGH